MSLKKDKGGNLFFKDSVFKVIELIFNNPNAEFHLRGISYSTNLSTTAVVKVIDKLQKQKIITVEKTPITNKIKTNQESESYLFYKKIFNLYRLEKYGVIKIIKEAYRAKTIVLFGSFSKGEDVEGSDIDILILTNQKEKSDLRKFLNLIEKKLNRKINMVMLKSLEKSSSEFKNSVANGTILHGYLKVI